MNKPRRAPRRRVDGVLLFDKPQGVSSNGALQTVRRLFNAEKAGHTGTLDPMATGLLPLCLGEATKYSSELLDADKRYRATVRLGMSTDSGDADGQVVLVRPVTVDRQQMLAVLARFTGDIEQVPPMFSALKRDGKPLYEYARAGIEVERAARRVRIHRIELLAFADDVAEIEVSCSKGTYIRTLAADVGESLGCGGHLTALRRVAIGDLDVAQAISLAQLEAMTGEDRDRCLLAADALLEKLPAVTLNALETERVLHGQALRWRGEYAARFRLYSDAGQFVGTAELSDDGWLKPRRLIASTNP